MRGGVLCAPRRYTAMWSYDGLTSGALRGGVGASEVPASWSMTVASSVFSWFVGVDEWRGGGFGCGCRAQGWLRPACAGGPRARGRRGLRASFAALDVAPGAVPWIHEVMVTVVSSTVTRLFRGLRRRGGVGEAESAFGDFEGDHHHPSVSGCMAHQEIMRGCRDFPLHLIRRR